MDSRHIRNAAIITALNSGIETRVKEALEEIRIYGNADILTEFISFIFNDASEQYRSEAFQILNDIKDHEAIPVLVEALTRYRGKKDFNYLVSSCWQNGLDFSPYISLFVNILIEDELNVAIEAYSVIEENFHLLGIIEKQTLIASLKEISLAGRDKDVCRKKLIVTLIEMLDRSDGIY